MNILGTLTPAQAARSPWDVVVIGAGPAGSMAAFLLAGRGRRVLLVESKTFPREKTCGGCLNQRAWSLLSHQGFDQDILRTGAMPLSHIRLVCGDLCARWSMPAMLALRRSALDAILVRRAIAAGAEFLPQTRACVAPDSPGTMPREPVTVRLSHAAEGTHSVRAPVVVCADGLGRPSLKDLPGFAGSIDRRSLLGGGAIIDDSGREGPAGELTMVVGREGYVGMTRVDHDGLNVAAAIQPDLLARFRQPGDAVRHLLQSCRRELPSGWERARWTGTPALTRVQKVIAGRGLFVIGDAAGYTEPFTGEGISWALVSAELAAPLVDAACSGWNPQLQRAWEQIWQNQIVCQQWLCRGLAKLLRRPQIARWSLQACRAVPALPAWIMRQISGGAKTNLTQLAAMARELPYLAEYDSTP